MTNVNIVAENNNATVVALYKGFNNTSESYQSERELELEFIKTLTEQSYERLNINSEDELINNLRGCLERLNNYTFSDNEWDYLFNSVIANKNNGILDKTRLIQEDNVHTIDLDDGNKKNIKLIDKDNIHNNILQVTNQYEVDGNHKNIYDVTVLVNGLPLVHIELKRRGVHLKEAFNQIDRYQRDSFFSNSGLFEFVQIFVISNGTYTKYYSNTTRDLHVKNNIYKVAANTYEFTSYWADQNNNAILDLIDFAKTFFAKHSILNILTKYCVFTSDSNLLVLRPYQIVATEKIINKIEIGNNYKFYGDIKAGGFVWHTTGSGKTLTSFKTSLLASKLDFIDKVIFVVDRKDLDYQTMKEYDKFQKGAANSNTSTKVLEKQLNDGSKIIITTIQKLDGFIKKNNKHDIYNKQVVFIFDECHRSQFGDMQKRIVKAFNKYYLFGFTGTPIFKENAKTVKGIMQTTEQVFGDKLHTYTIVNAINDKNVLPFRYDYVKTISIKENINNKKVVGIDTEEVLSSPERISAITDYIIENYSTKTNTSESYIYNTLENVIEVAKSNKNKEKKIKKNIKGFNSIFAVSSINDAKKYYSSFKNTNHNLKVAIIYSFGMNDEVLFIDEENPESTENLNKSDRDFLDNAIKDYNEMFGTSYDTSSEKFQNYYKDVSLRMKNKEVDILIVANMFLTGFDATTLNTLWVDKNLKYHGLIQAFSRTNRILNSVKTYGNIVSFRNLEKDLQDALSLFGNSESTGVVLLKTFDEYYNGYTDNNKTFVGYKNLVNELLEKYNPSELIIGENNQKEFIKLYSQILKVTNILNSFEDFKISKLLTERDTQNYHGMYLNIYDEFKNKDKQDKTDILNDVVFELELVKQIEVNIDYILMLIEKYNNTNDKEILVSVNKAVMASPELRNKKDLIEQFISSLDGSINIYDDFEDFMNSKKCEELNKIIEEENLNKEETYNFISNSFLNGKVETLGTDITKILPPVSRFSKENNSLNKKNNVIDKLQKFFDKFFSISSSKF